MANSWLRLWHDMPNDPKWRTISKASKQSIPSVISVYIHLLVIASNATERGRTQNVCSEDLASALDLDTEQVDAIVAAMQGRVLDGDMVSGWTKRQVEREDGAAERAKRWREARKETKKTPENANERKRTPDTDTDTDTDTDKNKTKRTVVAYPEAFEKTWLEYPTRPGASKRDAFKAWDARVTAGVDPESIRLGVVRYAGYCRTVGTEPQFIKQPTTFFGPGEHYLSDWTAPARASPTGYESEKDRSRREFAESIWGKADEPATERDITADACRLD